MAFDCHHRKKPLLYADLFKRSAEKEAESLAIPNTEGSSSSSQLSSPCGSYSSGFSTPLYSDFESEDGDFIAELSRQMAERMLQDEDEKEENEKKSDPSSGGCSEKKNGSIRLDTSGGAIDGRKNGTDSGRAGLDERFPPIHVVELKNQVPRKEDQFVGGRRVKRTETTQPKTQRHHHRQTRYKGRNGSGMQAVFLGRSGSVNVQPGTGVFLPRLNTDPAEPRKKSGCSIVLMPTRVLQTLELHFKQRHQSITSLPLHDGGPHVHSWPKLGESTISKEHSQLEKDPPNGDEMQLPQEWTYEQ